MDVISFSEAATANSRIKIINANPDSSSGIVTVPKTIASGETVTIPAGRVAVLPNVQIDGVLNVEGEVFVPSGSTYGDLDAQIALKANTADLKEIGVGQTWQDVAASRVINTTYTNTTGKPIMINIVTPFTTAYIAIDVNGIIVASIDPDMYLHSATMSVIVPNGATYSVVGAGFLNWKELR